MNWVFVGFYGQVGKANHVSKKDSRIQAKKNVAFQLLAQSQTQTEKVDLRKLTEYPLTPVPYSIVADGFLAKTDKVESSSPYCQGYWWQWSLRQPKGLHDNWRWKSAVSQSTGNSTSFGDIAHKILSSIVGHASPVIFSTDMYSENSIKSVERIRRGCGEMLIVSGEKTKRPKDWKSFLTKLMMTIKSNLCKWFWIHGILTHLQNCYVDTQ